MKITKYFEAIKDRSDRAQIKDEWVLQVIREPDKTFIQSNGRIRKWAVIAEMGSR